MSWDALLAALSTKSGQVFVMATGLATLLLTMVTIRKVLLESAELKRKAKEGAKARTQAPGALPPAPIPWTDPDLFVGRERELGEILQQIEVGTSQTIISITGLGGIGKTALACEAARRCSQHSVIWETAKDKELLGGTVRPADSGQLTTRSLLELVCHRLGRPELAKNEKTDTFKLHVRNLLQDKPSLLVMDNLETCCALSDVLATLHYICQPPSKAIVTSRTRLDDFDFIRTIQLTGLDEGQSIVFLRRDSAARRNSLAQESDVTLREIAKATGGAPLAMKLVVGQAARLPVDAVLTALRKAEGDIYPFIYLDSWRILSVNAQKLLVAMAAFAKPARTDALQGVSDLPAGALSGALDELALLSLVEVHDDPAAPMRRYGLHPLTRHFITSGLTEIWNRKKTS